MDHFAGLDVSVKETSICIVDETGRIVGEVKVASEPEALLQVLMNPAYYFKRIGLEAGPLSQWLFSALGEAGLPVICVETRHMQAVLKAQINKTDRNDARGIAQMMRVGLYRPVHMKTLRSQKLRMLLTHRKLLQSKAIAIDNDLRTLRNFGLKVGMVGKVKFDPANRLVAAELELRWNRVDPATGNFTGVFISGPAGSCPGVPYDLAGRVRGTRVVFQTWRNWTPDCRVTTVWSGRFVSPTTVAARGIATYVAPNGRMVRVRGTEIFQRI